MDTFEISDKYVLNTYKRFPLEFDKGNGIYLIASDGKKYIDMASGIAVSSVGHNHPKLIKAINQQTKKLLHVSNYYYTKPYSLLAEKLVHKSIFQKVFFCNSGAEANEAAIKLSRKHGKKVGGEDKYEIITLKNSFHGRTIATITATGQHKYHVGFEPLVPGFKYVEQNNFTELEKNIDNKTCGVIVELIQGEGGVCLTNLDFLQKIRNLCNEYNVLLIFDEVQTGIGRTGKFFGYEHYLPIEPDAITLAKGLGGGLPIGAILLKDKHAALLGPGEHASTFGGNPLCCAAANAVIDIIDEESLIENTQQMGQYFFDKLISLSKKYSVITDVRGIGLLLGIELNFPAIDLINKLIEKDIITVAAGSNVVRFLPPLTVKKEEIDLVLDALEKILIGI